MNKENMQIIENENSDFETQAVPQDKRKSFLVSQLFGLDLYF